MLYLSAQEKRVFIIGQMNISSLHVRRRRQYVFHFNYCTALNSLCVTFLLIFLTYNFSNILLFSETIFMYDNQTVNSVITDEVIWRSDISGVDRKGRHSKSSSFSSDSVRVWRDSRIVKLLKTPVIDSTEIDSLWESVTSWNWFSGGGRKDLRTKPIPALKINIYGTWPTRFHNWFLSVPRIDFSSHNPTWNTGTVKDFTTYTDTKSYFDILDSPLKVARCGFHGIDVLFHWATFLCWSGNIM